jgi:multidrug efflux pump subunit AcrB
MATVGIGWVKVKMLPFDNKSEFQVILNMPEGQLARADRRASPARWPPPPSHRARGDRLPGLRRHRFAVQLQRPRAPLLHARGANVADIQVNLLPNTTARPRATTSPSGSARASRPSPEHGARVAVAEVPPGPPVLQTLVAEVYGPDRRGPLALADAKVRRDLQKHRGRGRCRLVLEADQQKARFVIDKEKAALHGISAETISQTLKIAVGGLTVDLLHLPRERRSQHRLSCRARPSPHPEELLALRVRSGDANALPEPGRDRRAAAGAAARAGDVSSTTVDKSIYHKNLMPVTYVIGDVAGVVESPVYAIFKMNEALAEARHPRVRRQRRRIENPQRLDALHRRRAGHEMGRRVAHHHRGLPRSRAAFAACLILIYVLMVGWFRSFITPLIVMVAIPFSLVGILPAHGMMGAFFSATS